MKFGELLKEVREQNDISVKKLSDLSNVSTAYISKLENGKRNFPTEKYLFNLISGFKNLYMNMTEHYENVDDVKKIVEYEVKTLIERVLKTDDCIFDEKELNNIYERFTKYYEEELTKRVESNSTIKREIYENKIELIKNTDKGTPIDRPHFDLEWLLTQNEYEVFYGRSFVFKESILKKPALNGRDMFYYNSLTDNDIKTIKKLIDVYLESKYKKINDPEELFNILTKDKNYQTFENTDLVSLLLANDRYKKED